MYVCVFFFVLMYIINIIIAKELIFKKYTIIIYLAENYGYD